MKPIIFYRNVKYRCFICIICSLSILIHTNCRNKSNIQNTLKPSVNLEEFSLKFIRAICTKDESVFNSCIEKDSLLANLKKKRIY